MSHLHQLLKKPKKKQKERKDWEEKTNKPISNFLQDFSSDDDGEGGNSMEDVEAILASLGAGNVKNPLEAKDKEETPALPKTEVRDLILCHSMMGTKSLRYSRH